MLGRLSRFLIALALVIPLWGGEKPASISGYVRNTSGVPQMGAMVEVLSSSARALRVFTDDKGFYSATAILPGTYNIRVSAPSFLPALRERVGLAAGSNVIVNLTLTTLFDAVQAAPWRGPADEDDWKWVLRSASNRPILRAVEENSSAEYPSVQHSSVHHTSKDGEGSGASDVKGTLTFVAGSPSEGYGSASDMSTDFSVEKSMFSSDTVGLAGDVGYGDGTPAAVLRASYQHAMSNGSQPELALTMRSLPSPNVNFRNGSLQALALTTADQFALGDVVELKFGSELQTIQFMGHVTAFRPFGSADVHVSENTVVEYAYASSEPDNRTEKGFESAPADLSESQPRMTIASFSPALERAHHQEVSVSHRSGGTNLQLAVYADRIADPALTGVGAVTADGGDVLPDPYSGTFSYQGHDLNTHGVRIVAQRKLNSAVTATLDYGYGGALELDRPEVTLHEAQEYTNVRNHHTAAGKFSGTLPRSKTRWIASYRWINGQALTPVDLFNASAGQADPYLSLFVRQPIPGTGFLPCHMDAMIDIRNLLAQGYVPVMGQDGRTVYLVQSARAVRGGVSFTF